MKFLSSVLLLGILVLQPFAQIRSAVAISGVTVIDATGRPAASNMTVVIDGGLITQIGPTHSTKIPKSAQIIDGRGKFLIPGLWDMHAHVDSLGETA
jgi:imidazolonepropionase-like amidohydrolase